MTHVPAGASLISPGARRFSSMSPTIVYGGDDPVATLGAPDGTWIRVAILPGPAQPAGLGRGHAGGCYGATLLRRYRRDRHKQRQPLPHRGGTCRSWMRGPPVGAEPPIRGAARHIGMGRPAGGRCRPAAGRARGGSLLQAWMGTIHPTGTLSSDGQPAMEALARPTP